MPGGLIEGLLELTLAGSDMAVYEDIGAGTESPEGRVGVYDSNQRGSMEMRRQMQMHGGAGVADR